MSYVCKYRDYLTDRPCCTRHAVNVNDRWYLFCK